MKKELIGTKFLFDKTLIGYADLVDLMRTSGLYTDFIKKPIKDNLEVHSLYIKPDYEIAYLVKNEKSDEYYKTAGYSCVDYKEVTLQEVLDILGHKVPVKEEISEKQKKGKKSKFITLTNENDEYTFRKRKIDMLMYKNYKLEISYNNKCYYFEMSKERYKEVKRELKS